MKKNNERPLSVCEKLSPRERESLYWISQGKTAEEVAMILHLNIFTVKFYLRSIRQKLDCNTMAQAVYKAVKQEQI